MHRPLRSFPLASSYKAKLAEAGYETVDDLRTVRVEVLSKDLSVSHTVAQEIIQVVRDEEDQSTARAHNGGGAITALEVLKSEQERTPIVTFCASIDDMLGGGVQTGRITEFCGAPGIGKTQMSIQLSVDATIPAVFGGVEGEVVYVDTEGGFVVERAVEIASAAVQHVNAVSKTSKEEDMCTTAQQFTMEHVLNSIHYQRCYSYLELVAIINTLPDFITNHNKVKLIVVDNIACHFRHDFTDMGLRNRILSGVTQNLIKMATHYNVAVVLTNQMTTRFEGVGGGAQLTPALGDSWAHASTVRILLQWYGDTRQALLYKSPTQQPARATFMITEDGVRDATPLPHVESKIPPPPVVTTSPPCNEEAADEQDSFESTGFMTEALLCELDEFNELESSISKKPRLE